jgi:hypothetical protein
MEGSIHAINELWDEHKEEEEWGFLFIDARFGDLRRRLTTSISPSMQMTPVQEANSIELKFILKS